MSNGPGVYLSYKAADEITICNLRDSIKDVEKNLVDLQEIEDPTLGQIKDIEAESKLLAHLKAVLKYYGGSDV